MTICKILEGILPKERATGKQPPPDKKLLEYHFVFACVWAFGGCMLVDKVRLSPHHEWSIQGINRSPASNKPAWNVAGCFNHRAADVVFLQVTDYRTQFSKWWVSEWKAVAFPEKGLVFDFYVDESQVRVNTKLDFQHGMTLHC
jgi:dynein heavy chain